MIDFKNKQNKAPLKSQVLLDKSAKQRASSLSRIIYKTLLVVFVGVLVYVFLFSTYLQIEKIEVDGNQEIGSPAITQEVKAILEGKHLGVVSKNNFVLISGSSLEKSIAGKFKKISEINVSKEFPNAITISIRERKSLLVWCAGEACFLIDEKGVAYANADFSSPEVTENHLIKLVDSSAKQVAIGNTVLNDAYLQYVLRIKDSLKDGVGMSAAEEYVTPSAVSEEVNVTINEGFKIFFASNFPLEDAIKNLKLFLAKKIAPENILGHLEYIDLRSENKIFYKLKNAPENSDPAVNMDASEQTPEQQKTEADKKAAESKKK